MNKSTPQQVTSLLRKVEDVVIELDNAIDTQHIDHSALEKLKNKFDKAKDLIDDSILKDDSRLYVCHEADALFLWISNDKEASKNSVAKAVKIKGDTQLLSKSGRGLAVAMKTTKKDSTSQSMTPVNGWLKFFNVTTLALVICLLPVALLILLSLFLQPTTEIYPLVVAAVAWTLLILSVAYLVSATNRLKRAKSLAITLYGLLTLLCIVILFAANMYGNYDGLPGLQIFITLLFIFLIACGTATVLYYQSSEKVREIFIN